MAAWFRKFRSTLTAAIQRDYRNPRRLAFSAAVGVFCGASPFWGLHTALALLFALLLRLNTPAVLCGTLVSNPWFAPFLIFAGLEFGSWMVRGEGSILSLQEVRTLARDPEWTSIYREILLPYFWGSLALSALLAVCTFFLCWWIARAYWGSSRYQPRKGEAEPVGTGPQ
ncbi:MAG: DUF2062 domain-containing protein [bacterium]